MVASAILRADLLHPSGGLLIRNSRLLQPPHGTVRTPMISAASHQAIFLAIAFKNTSCIFIIRSISEPEYARFGSNTKLHVQAPLV